MTVRRATFFFLQFFSFLDLYSIALHIKPECKIDIFGPSPRAQRAQREIQYNPNPRQKEFQSEGKTDKIATESEGTRKRESLHFSFYER